jgi:hypothetical protein
MNYSVKQINRAWHLVMHHGYDAEKVADVMGCSLFDARQLISEAARMYDRPIDRFLNKPKAKPEEKEPMQRPPAEYSNTKFW